MASDRPPGSAADGSPPPGNGPGAPGRNGLARLAQALGVPEAKLASALAAAGVTPEELARAVEAGAAQGEAKVQAVASKLHVQRSTLAAAILEVAGTASAFASQAASAAEGFKATVRDSAEDALAIGLEVVGETIPRMVQQVLMVFAALGFAFVAIGLLALVDTPLFVQLLAVIAGVAMVAAGGLMFLVAWKIHGATASLRTVATIARRWRERRRERGPPAPPAS